MTPLRWRSSSSKQAQSSQNHNSSDHSIPTQAGDAQSSGRGSPVSPAEQSGIQEPQTQPQSSQNQNSSEHSPPTQTGIGQSSGGGNPASPAEQTGCQEVPASESVPNPAGRSLPEAVPLPEIPAQIENVSITDPDTSRTQALTAEPQKAEHTRSPSIGGKNGKDSVDGSPEVTEEPPEEIVNFQPVDLDQKYRRKELIKHITAAKIQNREESLLNNPSLPTQEGRKAPAGDEPAAMTIEFLRARLLAERQASKATKQQMAQLTKKVADFEARLAAEIELRHAEVELRKKAEAALQEALTKINQKVVPVEQGVKEASAVSAVGPQTTESGLTKPGDGTTAEPIPGTLAELLNINKTVLRPESGDSFPVDDRIVYAKASQNGSSGSENGSKSSVLSDSGSILEKDSSSPNQSKSREDTRTAVEDRLRTMWSQLGQEMAALVKGEEDKQELMGWMGQVPKVLQSKPSESNRSLAGNKLGVIRPDASLNLVKQPMEAKMEEGSKTDSVTTKPASNAAANGTLKTNGPFVKNESKFVEQYEAQETAQRVWEENQKSEETLGTEEDGLPPLVTADGNVISENGPNAGPLPRKSGVMRVVIVEDKSNGLRPSPLSKSKSFDMSSKTETQLPKSKSFDSPMKPAIARSRTKSFDLSHDTTAGNGSRRASFNGRIENIDDQAAGNVISDELIDDEDAEELPNGIYLHHSRDDDDSYRRSSKDLYRRTPERLPGSRGFHSPGSISDRGHQSNGYNSPGSRSDRGPNRERFASLGGPVDGMGDVDWSVREVKDRASRDVYNAPVMNSRSARGDVGPYIHSRTERGSDESPYRGGPASRWDPHMADSSWVQRQDERRMSDPHQSHSSSEDGSGVPHVSSERDIRAAYTYPDRDQLDHDLQYRNTYRQRGEFGPRGEYYRGMPPPWQELENPGVMRSRSMGQRPYAYPPPYSVDEPYLAPSIDAGGYNHYHGRPETYYPAHAASRPEYYSQYGMPGPRSSSMNGYSFPPENPSSVNRGYTWESGSPRPERSAAVVPTEDGPDGAGEVLKALRIAKQQIKSSAGEQQPYMTAQYTVSSEHRYGVGGQVSKTSYTVEAPVGYAPRVTKAFHEGWLLEGKPKRLGMDVSSPQITDLDTTAGTLAVTNDESSYVEKLNVGRGIQFFFG